MPAPRPYALIRTSDQWLRAAHEHTALEGEVVQLAREEYEPQGSPGSAPPPGAGLAFDSHCRLYHSVPGEGRVERVLWASQDPLQSTKEQPAPLDLFSSDARPAIGDFNLVDDASAPLKEPRGLAIDVDDRLFVAETGGRRILIYDLWDRRLLRSVQLGGRPIDLAARGRNVFCLLESPAGLMRLGAWTGPQVLNLPAGVSRPSRIAASPSGDLFILEDGRSVGARVVPLNDSSPSFAIPFATDVEFQASIGLDSGSVTLVVARLPKDDFLRFRINPSSVEETAPLKARGYDGLGIVTTPDGRIGFWTSEGFRHAVPARVRYASKGRVTTFRLDSGEFNTVWGRVFLDACIPRDASMRISCVAADEPPEESTLARTPPANIVSVVISRPDLSPPMPPLSLVVGADEPFQPLHRRETGMELPWARPAEGDSFETYEAPVLAEAGRYLWVTLELAGNTRVTPRVRALRAEYPSHDYLRRLPKLFSRDEQVASFLRRYLAMFEGTLGELEAKADTRHALLNPRSAPPEILPWLASFLGMAMDERWSVTAQRTLIEEATWLFRFRGTIGGLSRFLEIYLGTQVIFMEKFRSRGMGGAILGGDSTLVSNSILGAGFRVGGSIGDPNLSAVTGDIEDAFETHAHRFSVVIPASLTAEQLDVVRNILDVHRPAHTLVEVCTVDSGMRVGRGLHVELTSIIGRTSGFSTLQLGASVLGRAAVVGRPAEGIRLGGSRLGADSRVG